MPRYQVSVFTTSIMKDYLSRLTLLYLMLFIHVCQVYAQDDAESGSSDGGSAAAAGGGGEEGCPLTFAFYYSNHPTLIPNIRS